MNHLKTGNAFFAQGSYKSYKFLRNELQETGFYDMNARFYMADLGIFGQHDPLSASTLDPYGYAYNNPIFFADPTGLFGDPVNGGGGDIPVNSLGGSNNPIQIDEIVLNAPIKAIANNSGSILPNNCTLCYSGNGASSGLTPPVLPSPEEAMRRVQQPVLHNGSAQMMDGLLWDVAAIYLVNNVKPENRYAAAGVGLLAILLSRGHAADEILKAEAQIARAELAAERAEMTTLYRSVSPAELKDIASNGLRSGGGYETSKLFTTTAKDASFFSKNMGWKWDGTANTIIKVDVPKSVMQQATRFEADGIKSISIPSSLFQNVKSINPLNHSPLP